MADLQTGHRPLRDCIRPGVQVLFVGINPGLRSAQTGHHFAGHSNRFWKLLHESELVTERLTYREDRRLPEWRLGLTNIIGRSSAGIDELSPGEYQRGLAKLERKIRRFRPPVVALLGVTIFRMLFSHKEETSGSLNLGLTNRRLAGARIFLLPNPSGRNAHYSYSRMLAAFRTLRNRAIRSPGTRQTSGLQRGTR